MGIESTIVGFEEGKITVYRLGGLAVEEIEKIVGKVAVKINQSSNPKAPGMMKSHYAPKKPLFIGDVEVFLKENAGKKIGIISLEKLSPFKNLKEAAHNLFSALRDLDNSDVDAIVAEKFPDDFLGRAINDRLQRAAAK